MTAFTKEDMALARHHLNGGTVREIVGYVENGYVACAAKIWITMDCVVGGNRGANNGFSTNEA